MTQAELITAFKSLGIPVAYGEFISAPKHPAPPPPFITVQFTNSDDFLADNQNYLDISSFDIELYTSKKDPMKESLVQNKLKELRLPYSKIEAWIDSEKLYQIIYTIQLIGG